MKKLASYILAVCLVASSLFAVANVLGDSVINVKGTVVSSETKEPVEANIVYKRLPYESEIGKITASATGDFGFYTRGNGEYAIHIDAEGFLPYIETINMADESGEVLRSIELEPGGVGHVMELENLIFERAKATITNESHDELDKLFILLQESPTMEIQLEGHTDFRGNAQANMNLSQLRVNAVRDYLVNKGVSNARMTTRAFGGTSPKSRESNAEAQRINRRVEVRITKM